MAHAERFLLRHPTEEDIVGKLTYTRAYGKDTLVDIARRNDLGYKQIVKANPTVNRWVPGEGTEVLITHFYILPSGERKGIVLNLAELRLYYYEKKHDTGYQEVRTYPVSVGREGCPTPIVNSTIVSKERNPAWYPPDSIRKEASQEGRSLPRVIPGGDPKNPLGKYALRLKMRSYLIHGTNKRTAYGIGMRVSHGCIRMYPEDIEELYKRVSIGTPVSIVDQPVKLGWRRNVLYLEVHTPLEEADYKEPLVTDEILDAITKKATKNAQNLAVIDKEAVIQAVRVASGIPTAVAW